MQLLILYPINITQISKMKNSQPDSKPSQKFPQRSSILRPSPVQVPHVQLSHQPSMITEIHSQQPHDQPEPPSANHKPSSQKVQQLITLFKLNEIPTKSYRLIIEQIAHSFTTMDSLTIHLEQKVDHMLKLQQNEFVQSYKTHMKKVQEEFASVDKKIEDYEKKIAYYENEGEMSQLFIKVNKLEEECRRLYKDLAEKDKVNKDHLLTIKVQKSQLKRYEKELKLLLREKNDLIFQLNQLKNSLDKDKPSFNLPESQLKLPQKPQQQLTDRSQVPQPIRQLQSIHSTKYIGFPTELQTRNKNDKSPNDLSTEYHFGSNQSRSRQHLPIKDSLKSLTLDLSLEKPSPLSNQNTPLISKVRQMQLKRQLNSLKKKNQMLNSFQSYVLEAKTDMESFFVDCVNEIKQQIKIRKKISFCTFEDWKKQDKIDLLIKIISNDDILAYLYERVFKKKRVFGGSEDKKLVSSQQMHNQQKGIESHIYPRRFEAETIDSKPKPTNKDKTIDSRKDQTNGKVLSAAKRRFSKHISENSLLPKIHFHLEYGF